jgi:hypothetical protein
MPLRGIRQTLNGCGGANNKEEMKSTLRIIGILGLLLFGMLFGFTFGMPDAVEASAKGFVKNQIESEIKEKYQSSKASSVAEKALAIANRLGYEEEDIRQKLHDKLPEKIAAVIASLCGYDCEKKKALTKSITKSYLERISNLQIAQKKLGDIIKGKYLEIVGNLRADLRIFLGSNAVMFLILLFVSLQKPGAIAHLFLPGILLLVSTVIASVIYLLGQDWFYTILYNDYVGFGYLAYIGLIFGFFMDVIFNKARATAEVINSLLHSIGSALTLGPC